MAHAFYLVFTQLTLGCLLLQWPVRRHFGFGMVWSNGLVILGLAATALALGGPAGAVGPAALIGALAFRVCFAALAAYNVAVWRTRIQKVAGPLLVLCCCAAAVSVVASALEFYGEVKPSWAASTLPFLFLVSACVLGGALIGMLVGHGYLTRPSMAFGPLVWFARFFLISSIIYAAMSGTVLLVAALDGQGSVLLQALAPRTPVDLFPWIRVLLGLLGPVALGWMILESAKVKANMSATGLFYIVTAFVLVGEIVARVYLVRQGLVL